ncbi:MAG TPA: hypothetical protein PKC30_11565 [Saprospiraceae bacterium]|nr:hypothetical protein [Saprospiraceae bacterium]
MKTEYIKSLLEKYWEAESSLDEERILSEYFNSRNVDDELRKYASLFKYYKSASLMNMGGKEIEFPGAKLISLRRKNLYKAISIAASVLIMITAGYFLMSDSKVNTPVEMAYHLQTGEVTDEAMAMEITLDALAYLGYKLDKTSGTVRSNLDKIETINIFK